MKKSIFDNLFVLELANNHWGDLERGKEIVRQFAKVVKENNVRAAIKLQFRDTDNFIHKDFKNVGEGADLTTLHKRNRYIQKQARTKLSYEQFKELVTYIKKHDCIPMSTPFDEKSVDWCVDLDLSIIKIASSDINDWLLLNKIATTNKPVIISTGGANDKQIDDVIKFFTNRNIPIAVNHCVSKYPSEDNELELDQIDYLKTKYPDLVIGLSTHEYHDWHSSMYISYAKGARTWERHIDIPYPVGHEQKEVSNYCSLPHQVDEWFKYFHKAKEMCGNSYENRRVLTSKEIEYLDALVRGVYAKRDLPFGYVVDSKSFAKDFQLAVPLRKGQLSTREILNGLTLKVELKAGTPVTIDDVDGPYAENLDLRNLIQNRGI
jgi:N-acetylneuraminate synthase